tara:strand:- start:7456 stop:9153 length:1698 start_codon:yes stop_codon:yes gene_type:complete
MAGGLLNIAAVGQANVFLTGNPSKTFFKVTYCKHSNFGLQKFRIDYDGLRELRLTEPSTFKFKIPRHADLLMDTYVVVTLPDIWSPIHHPLPVPQYVEDGNNIIPDLVNGSDTGCRWAPYEFKWIENIGAHMIEEIEITCGSHVLQKYTGEYLAMMVERDFSKEKKDLFNKMSGNIPELNDPANHYNRKNSYPSAFYTSNTAGAEPSIRGRNLYIPVNTWFTLNSGCAFPLIALQYNELHISVTFRPIQDLFKVRDVFDVQYNYPYIQPNFNESRFQMYRFLQTPPAIDISSENYTNKISTWNADIHLVSTYCFLSTQEAEVFAKQDHVYLIKDVFAHKFENITGSKRIKLQSANGMISSWMWKLQRNDVNLRNEWDNYTNWPYNTMPSNSVTYYNESLQGQFPNVDPFDLKVTGILTTGDFSVENRREILETMGIVLDGEYRENVLPRGIYDYIEKYTRTKGSGKEGLYCYNFCLDTNPMEYQPSGAINLSKFKNIDLEITTYVPPIDEINSRFDVICGIEGAPLGYRKENWRLYDYNFNLTLYEERYNILSFIGGSCGMLHAR